MDDREERALGALASMVKQFLEERPDELVESDAMGAGERAIHALSEFGYGKGHCRPYLRALDRCRPRALPVGFR